MPDKIKGLSLAIGGDTGGLAAALKEINTLSKNMETDLRAVQKLLKLDPTNTTLLAQQQDLLAKNIETAKQKLNELEKCEESVQMAFADGTIEQTQFIEFQKELVNTRKKLEDLQAQEKEAKEKTSNLGDETQDTAKDIKDLGNEAKNAKKDTDDLGEETKETKQKIKDLGDQSLKTGDVMKESLKAEAIVSSLKVIGNAVKDVSKAAINVGSDFEASMSQVAATMGMTKEDVRSGASDYKKLEKAAEDMGASTKYTSAQAADALNYLALAGYDANKAVETLPKILTIAQAGGMDIATTSDLVTDSMGALQLGTDKLDMHIDQMAKTAQKSNTNIQQLGEAQLVVAGTSVSTGQDISKVNTALGILANNGIKGAEGGTKLRNILLSLTAPTDKAAGKIEELGLSVTDSSGKIRDIDDIMSDLNKTLGRMSSDSERTQVLNTIFNKADLAGVSALLESTNGSFGNLYENIVNSNGAAADMADTMNDNFKGRMAEVNSALEAVGIAAYKKFEVPLKGAAKKTSKEFSEFADSINDGDLSESFEDLGDSFETFVDVGLEAVEFVIPPLTKGLGWVLEHSSVIIGGLTGIASAMITQKTVTTVAKTAHGFSDLASAINKAKGAQATFNAISSATPWGAIGTLAGLAVGAVVTYGLESKTAAEKMSYLTDEQKTLIERSQDINDEIKNNQKTREDNIKDTESQWKGYKTMADKLYELNDAETISVGQKAQMKGMVDELNKAMPDLNLQLDEETGHLDKQKSIVMDLIDCNMELAKVKGAQESLSVISKDLAKAEINASKLEYSYKSSKKELDNLNKSMNKNREEVKKTENAVADGSITMAQARARYDELDKSYGDMATEQRKLQKSTDKLEQEYKIANNTLKDAQEEWDTTSKYISDHSEKLEKTAETAEVATEKIKITVGKYKGQTVEVVQTAIDEIQRLEDEYQEAYCARAQELQDSLDIFKEFSLNSEVTADKLLNNMESNLKGMTNWADGLNTLAKRGLDEGLIQKLREAGPSSASEVAAMTKMTDEQLEKYNKDWRTYTSKIKGIVSKEMQGARKEINQKVDDAIKDVNKKQPNASSAGSNIGSAIGNSMKSSYDNTKATNHIKQDLENLITDAHNDYKQRLYSGFYDIGSFIDEGLKAGLKDNSHKATYETEVLANSVLYTGNKTFGIHSPSKKFYEIGDYCVQGQILGMKDRERELFSEIEKINYGIIDRAQNISLGNSLELANQTARKLIENPESERNKLDSKNENSQKNSTTYNFNVTFSGVTINNDQDLNDIADKLMHIMEEKTRRKDAVYS